MSRIIPSFVPSASNTSGTIEVGAGDAGSKLLLFNKSPFDLLLDFQNGHTAYSHAKQARFYVLDGDTPEIQWSVPSSQNVVNPAISIVQGELYGAEEVIPGNYPAHLDTQTDASNSLSHTSHATFQMKAQDITNGNNGAVSIVPTTGKTAYITGFCLSAQPGAANISYQVNVTGVNPIHSPTYWIESTTTDGCFRVVPFPTPQPATGPGVNAGVSLITNANAQATLIIYGYYV